MLRNNGSLFKYLFDSEQSYSLTIFVHRNISKLRRTRCRWTPARILRRKLWVIATEPKTLCSLRKRSIVITEGLEL